jgi:hypothetical protein
MRPKVVLSADSMLVWSAVHCVLNDNSLSDLHLMMFTMAVPWSRNYIHRLYNYRECSVQSPWDRVMRSVADKALVTTTSNCAVVCRVGFKWTVSLPTGYKGISSDCLEEEGNKLRQFPWTCLTKWVNSSFYMIYLLMCVCQSRLRNTHVRKAK